MQRVKIVLPAVVTHLGPAVAGLGLALGLHTTVEIGERGDDEWIVETAGEGAGRYGLGLRHPVTRGMIRVFQRLERAPAGATIRIQNSIPYGADLGVDAVFVCAGVIGANNLVGTPLKRADVIALAAETAGRPDQVVPGILGGLTTALASDHAPLYRTLPTAALKAVLVLPQSEPHDDSPARTAGVRVPLDDALYNVSRIPLLLDAFRSGDLALLASVMDDHLSTIKLPRGYDKAIPAAKASGAAVTLSGGAILAFSSGDHRALADSIQAAFNTVGIVARWWSLGVDTQGVVVSVVGM
jgi:homoserine kinase